MYFKSRCSSSINIINLIPKIINKQLDKFPVNPTILLDKNDTPKQFFVPTSLLAYMWFQFFQVVGGERKIKQCAICGKWADVTERRATWKHHNSCGINARTKRSRENKKKACE